MLFDGALMPCNAFLIFFDISFPVQESIKVHKVLPWNIKVFSKQIKVVFYPYRSYFFPCEDRDFWPINTVFCVHFIKKSLFFGQCDHILWYFSISLHRLDPRWRNPSRHLFIEKTLRRRYFLWSKFSQNFTLIEDNATNGVSALADIVFLSLSRHTSEIVAYTYLKERGLSRCCLSN